MPGKLQFSSEIKCGAGAGISENFKTEKINSTPVTDVGKRIRGLDLGPGDALGLSSITETANLELAIFVPDGELVLCFDATTGPQHNSSFVLAANVPFILSSIGTLNYNAAFGTRMYNPTDRTLSNITLYNASTTETVSVEIFAV